MAKCKGCGKQLTNEQSIERGFGPECHTKWLRYLAQKDAKETTLKTTIKLAEAEPTQVLVGIGMYSDTEFIVVEKLADGAIRKVPTGTFYSSKEAAESAAGWATTRYLHNSKNNLTPRMYIPSQYR